MPDQADHLDRLNTALRERYRLERELGRGGMATVYLAEDLKHHREVAIKVLNPELTASVGAERFLREIEIAAKLHHPNILMLIDSGEADGFLYYVMPYVAGESLRDRLHRERQLRIEDAIQIARDVAGALGHAHREGVVHRDIKPENILLDAGRAVVTDFGVARAVSVAGGEKLTATGVAVGTPHYMSPEQAAGRGAIDGRSDIYGLGCVLYEMLGGEPPFTGPSAQAILARHAVDPVPNLRTLRGTVPEGMVQVVARTLNKSPADRFGTAEDLVEALHPECISAAVRVPGEGRGLRPVLRHPAWLGIGAVVLLGAAVWTIRGSDAAAPRATSPDRIAVFPFEVQAALEREYLGHGVMTLLSAAIDGAGDLRRVDPQALTSLLRRDRHDAVGPDLARDISARFGAGRFLLGTVVAAGPSVAISASLYDPSRGADPVANVSAEGAEEELTALVTQVARSMLDQMGAMTGVGVVEVSEVRTASYAALKAYLVGEDFLHRGQYDSAVAALEQAVERDSTFALAWQRLALAHEFASPGQAAVYVSMAQAMRYGDDLPPRERLQLDASHAWLFGDGDRAERLLLEIVADYPDQREAWYWLGAVRDFYRWQRPRPLSDVLDSYRRAHVLGLDHPTFVWNYSWALRRARQVRLADSLYRAGSRAGRPIVFSEAHVALMALLRGGDAQRGSVLAELSEADITTLWWVIHWLHTTGDSLGLIRPVAELMLDAASRPAWLRAAGHHELAELELAAGRWRAAGAEFSAAARLEPDTATFWVGETALADYAFMSVTPFLQVPPADLVAIRDSLRRARFPQEVAQSYPFAGVNVSPHLRSYLLGLVNARLGQSDSALAHAESLEGATEPTDSIGLLRDLALEIRSLIAARQGGPDAALAVLEQAELRVTSLHSSAGPWYARPLGRLLRAEWLFEVGRYEEALGWFGGFPYLVPTSLFESAYLSHIYGRMGEIYDVLGDRNNAMDYYGRFVARWEDCDPALRARVEEASVRLAELRDRRTS